jgi:hypothetical protein
LTVSPAIEVTEPSKKHRVVSRARVTNLILLP